MGYNFRINDWEESLQNVLRNDDEYYDKILEVASYLTDNINTNKLDDLIPVADICYSASPDGRILRALYRTLTNAPFCYTEHVMLGSLEVTGVRYPYRSRIAHNWSKFKRKYKKLLR